MTNGISPVRKWFRHWILVQLDFYRFSDHAAAMSKSLGAPWKQPPTNITLEYSVTRPLRSPSEAHLCLQMDDAGLSADYPHTSLPSLPCT